MASFPESPLRRPIWQSLQRGARRSCPACGKGELFGRYLSISDHCPSCAEALHHHRTDDAAPFLALFLTAHVVVPMAFLVGYLWAPPAWVHAALWLPVSLALTLMVLPSVKGAMVGVEWAMRMHGFEYESLSARLAGSQRTTKSNRGPLAEHSFGKPDGSPA